MASRATGLIGHDEDLRRTREMAGTLVRTWSLGPALTTDLDVVPDEVLSNIVRHGLRHGREHEICIPLAVEPDTVTLTAATSASRNGTAWYSGTGDRGQASPPREAPNAGAPKRPCARRSTACPKSSPA